MMYFTKRWAHGSRVVPFDFCDQIPRAESILWNDDVLELMHQYAEAYCAARFPRCIDDHEIGRRAIFWHELLVQEILRALDALERRIQVLNLGPV